MTRMPQASFADALAWWQFSAAWWSEDACTPVTCADWPRRKAWWVRGGRGDLAGSVRDLDERDDVEIRVGLPRQGGYGRSLHDCGVGRASLLWCRVEGGDQLARARRFRPVPPVVFAEGSSTRRVLFWPLEEPRPWVEIKDANRKIAYALHAVQKHADPELFVFSPPGTCLREGRSRPAPVRVARLRLDTFLLPEVAEKLREPPEPQWMGATGR